MRSAAGASLPRTAVLTRFDDRGGDPLILALPLSAGEGEGPLPGREIPVAPNDRFPLASR